LSGPCPGTTPHLSIRRANLCSIATSFHILHSICSVLDMRGCSISVYNNSSKAIKLITNPGRKFKIFLSDDFDLHNEARDILSKLRLHNTINLQWVNSNSSNYNRGLGYGLIQEAHRTATFFLPSHTIHHDMLPPSCIVSLSQSSRLTSHWKAILSESAHSPALQQTIYKNSKWSDDMFNVVDRPALQRCLSGLPHLCQLLNC